MSPNYKETVTSKRQKVVTVGILPPPEPHDIKVISDVLERGAATLTALAIMLRSHQHVHTPVANALWAEANEWFMMIVDKVVKLPVDNRR